MNPMEMSDDRDVQTIADHGEFLARAKSPVLTRQRITDRQRRALDPHLAEEARAIRRRQSRRGNPTAQEPPPEEPSASTAKQPARGIRRDGEFGESSEESALEKESEGAAGGDLAAIEIPPALAGFMEKLLAASRKTAVESEAPVAPLGVVGKMESPLVRELRAQVEQHAARAVEDAAAKANAEIQRNSEKLAEQHSAGAEEFYQRWKDEYDATGPTVREQLSAEMEERLAARNDGHSDIETEFRGDITRGREIDAGAGTPDRVVALGAELAAETTTSHLAQLRLQVETLNARVEEQMRARPSEESKAADDEAAMIDWRRRLKRESDTARGQWMELLDSSLDSAMQRLAARLADETQNALNAGDRQIEVRAAELSGPAWRSWPRRREALTHVESMLEAQVSRRPCVTGGARTGCGTAPKRTRSQWESHGKATIERLERPARENPQQSDCRTESAVPKPWRRVWCRKSLRLWKSPAIRLLPKR